jgi:2-methylcitrate dehydratase PrpD
MKAIDESVTGQLARLASTLQFDALPADVIGMAKLCIADWIAVTTLGASEPLASILVDEAIERGAHGQCSLPGRHEQLGLIDAALINGAASHALDYDDGSAAMGGHATVAVASAVLPLAEFRRASGRDAIAAFVAGYEMACRIGLLATPQHYAQGFHPTGTVGTLGAAGAAANLLGLDADTTAVALGIASTQAAGLIANFGTMSKPLHPGRAAANGVLSARLAARGFTARPDSLEIPYGFVRAHNGVPAIDEALATPAAGFHILNNVFKFHAACGGTHGVVESARELRQRGIQPHAVKKIRARVNPKFIRICNIAEPRTGLELKFSYRAMIAAALLGLDTASPALYSDATACDPALIAIRDKVEIEFTEDMSESHSELIIDTQDGTTASAQFNTRSQIGSPTLKPRVAEKFLSLTSSVLGAGQAQQLQQQIARLEDVADIGALLRLATPRP